MYLRPHAIIVLLAAAVFPGAAFAAGPVGAVPAFQSDMQLIPVAKKGSVSTGYSCDGLQCTCQGDVDCNDMFGSGKCGDVASCDSDTGICKCLILKTTPPKSRRPDVKGRQKLLNSQ